MKLALIQMTTHSSNDQNLHHAVARIIEAAADGADMVVLPEMFCCPYQTANFPLYAQPESGENVRVLRACAKDCGVYLVAGSMPEETDGKIYNTSYVFDRQGATIAKHRKVHLFDIDIKGGQRFMESETLTAGDQLTLFDTKFGRFGLLICFDIRFAEMSMELARQGAQCIVVPAAFNMTTGPLHWELLFRARAMDNQIHMVGAAPARDEASSYVSYANSIAVSPWGKIIGRLDAADATLYCELDFNENQAVQAQIPLHR